MLIAKYDNVGKIYFEEFHPPPFDMRRQQSGMFTDRPDLWRKPSRKVKPPAREQYQMFSDPSDLHIDFTKPVACALKARE